tara:strand:+ start:102 stop:1064 length:963 start_codon:yes stop_codon:yes gene_type:complete
MEEIDNNDYVNNLDDIDLREIFFALFKGKLIILFITSFLSVSGIIYSLILPNLYKAESLLAPVESSSSLLNSLGEYSSLAGLVGINLPGGDSDENSKKAFEVMTSLSFFENHIMPKIFLADLMAVKSWNHEKNKIIYNKNVFDENSATWVRNFSYPQRLIPSAQESFEVFKDDHLSLEEDKKTGYLTLSIVHQSPFIAKQWVEIIFNEVNAFYREKDKMQSEKAIVYLQDQFVKTSFSEVKVVTASLIQQEIQKLTLIEANKDYVFEYIYPPSVMEENSEPSRSLIVTLFTFFGFIFSVIIVLFRHYYLKSLSKKNIEMK